VREAEVAWKKLDAELRAAQENCLVESKAAWKRLLVALDVIQKRQAADANTLRVEEGSARHP